MTIIDITRQLAGNSLTYPGDTTPHFTQRDSGLYLISDIQLSSHSGTHIDAPVHYLKTGLTIDELPLPHLVGPCRVLDVSNAGSLIDASHIKGRTGGVPRILLKTTFSGCTSFQEDYPSLTRDAAEYLTKTGTLCVGIDSFSIEAFVCDGSVHRELLSHGCIIIELLDLSRVPEGDYTLIALPLRLAGLDGAPARVILLDKEGCE
ncbi:MAG: cyclase family protein [Methanoregula sp.]|uniref:cyclase family protein n=1 Tax=Methanoregula sp. TaxID=2052170 RepID=UPI0025D36163|nr:cyclase family protein [Methanoregula sp.]MCK9631142.1 cyclase family protein [Methanoregula sp.]